MVFGTALWLIPRLVLYVEPNRIHFCPNIGLKRDPASLRHCLSAVQCQGVMAAEYSSCLLSSCVCRNRQKARFKRKNELGDVGYEVLRKYGAKTRAGSLAALLFCHTVIMSFCLSVTLSALRTVYLPVCLTF